MVANLDSTHTGYDDSSAVTRTASDAGRSSHLAPLQLDGKEWVAYVNLPMGRIDQLVDPLGQQVPLP